MVSLALLLIAASQPGAQAVASARIVAGERIALTQPAEAPDRQLTAGETRLKTQGDRVTVRLVEFH